MCCRHIESNGAILLFEPLGTNFSVISMKMQQFLSKKLNTKVRSIKYQPCYHGLNVLINTGLIHDFKSALILLLCSCHLYNSKGTVLLSAYTFALYTLILIHFINIKSSLNQCPGIPFISDISENFRVPKFVEPNVSLLAQYWRHMTVILSRVTGNSTMCSTVCLDLHQRKC